MSSPVDRLITFFETLSPERLAQLPAFYAPQAHFKDPFNDVRGVPAIEKIFRHMYVALDRPRFVVTDAITQGNQCFLTWNFEFYFRRFDTATLQTVRGGSHLRLTDNGLIALHRDYWDAAEELYEKLPVVGRLMRWLKQRANQ
ncbi:MAG: nuclear transport factor 2 family protein [Polaromonas sp.]|nr:nuclear transport factor 2 family protein [Polaromonas sp.]